LPIDLKFWEEVYPWSMHRALRARLPPVPSFCETQFLLLNFDKLGHSMGTRHWQTLCLDTQVNNVDINVDAKFQLARMTVSRATALTNIPKISLYM
jgi:hypothetical protein